MGATNFTLPSTIKPGASARYYEVFSGEAIPIGRAAYISPTDNKAYLAKGDTQIHAAGKGIATNATSGADQPIKLQYAGTIINASGLPVGRPIVISDDTFGNLMQASDLGTGDWGCLMGFAPTATTFEVNIVASGAAFA